MTTMTGGQALMRSLYREGVRVIFGLPGVQLYHALDALNDVPGIRFIATRHEQATVYMADGYARAGGGIGTALMVPGPGLLNAAAAISTAYSASSPVLVVSGQIERDLIGVDRGILHEVNDQQDCIRPITKHVRRIMTPGETPEAVHEAFRQLSTGRPRPVEIEMPPETMAEPGAVDLREPAGYPRVPASAAQVDEAARILAGARRPLIWAGGGVIASAASAALVRLAERLQAPVITTHEGKGAIDDRHPLALGALRLRNDPIAKDAPHFDVILGVGSRMAFPMWLDGQQVVQIDIDPDELGRNWPNTYGIAADAGAAMGQLEQRLSELIDAPRPSFAAETAELRERRQATALRPEPQESYLAAVRAAVPDDGILVSGMTQLGYYARAFWPTYAPRTFITSGYSGNLGYAYPTALGAKVAQPDRPVVALCGDGGFLFNSQELATAAQYGINAVAVVFNDNAYGNVLRDQVTQFGSDRTTGAALHNPDFVRLAEAYGVRAVRAEGPEALETMLRDALAADGPALIEVPVGMMPTPFT